MQQDPIDDIFEEEMPTDRYDQTQLKKLSLEARSSFNEIQGQAETAQVQSDNQQFDFKDRLHFQTLIEETRQIIYQCNIQLTDLMVTLSLNNLTSSQSSIKYKNQEYNEENQLGLSRSEIQSEIIQENWLEELKKIFQSFKKTLTLREVQLTMVLFVMEHKRVINFKATYMKYYGALAPYIIDVQDAHKPINLFILEGLCKKQNQFLITYLKQIIKMKSYGEIDNSSSNVTKSQVRRIIGKIKVLHSKINTITEVFPYACVKDKDDLFSYPYSHHRWQNLTATGQIKHIAFADQITLSSSFDQLKNSLTLVNAAMSVIDRQKLSPQQTITKKFQRLIQTATQVIRMTLFKAQAQHQANLMMAQPVQYLPKQIWNLPENRKFRQLIDLSLPRITFSEVFYVPRILKQYFIKRYWQNYTVDFPDMLINGYAGYRDQLSKKQNYETTIRIRVNSPFIPAKIQNTKQNEQEHKGKKGIFNIFSNWFAKQLKTQSHAIIFHIHGGGFVSMSSFIHQTYTRLWSNNLSVPIVSVDYGKAPNYPFPQGLYDCFEAYMWTLLSFKQIYEIYPQKIVIVGDSAGGNLSAALVNLLIMWGLPVPAGLVLVYPALNLNINQYTPSLLAALNDMILPHTFLKLCQKAYLKDEKLKPGADPLISPILTPSQILAKYPKTEMFVGAKDPFHDDCCRMVQKMNILKPNNASLTIFEQFPHGFLQFDLRLLPNEYSREATKIVEKAIGSLLFD